MSGTWRGGSSEQQRGFPYGHGKWSCEAQGRWSWTQAGAPPQHVGGQGNIHKRAWTCHGCQSANHSKNACSTCGMRKSYASVVAQTVQAAPHQQSAPHQVGNPVRAQLQQVAEALTKVVASAPTEAPQPGLPTNVSKSDVRARIKCLEAVLASMPAEDDDLKQERDAVLAKIAFQKSLIREAPLPGARLDSALAALTRARGRKEGIRLSD